jgi:hypothetical protein
MPIKTAQFTLGSAVRTLIAPNDTMSQLVRVHDHEHAANSTIFIGGADLTLSNGLHLKSLETADIEIGPGDELYAISDTADVELHVLRVTQD